MTERPHPDDLLATADVLSMLGQPRAASRVKLCGEVWEGERAIVEAVGRCNPVARSVRFPFVQYVCILCGAADWKSYAVPHATFCPWLLARKWEHALSEGWPST